MKKVGIFFLLFLWVMGVVGGLGFALYSKASFPIVVGMVVNVLFAIPTGVKLWKKFNS